MEVVLDGSGPAHMRYSVRRLRQKLPTAVIILCCWFKDAEPAELQRLHETSKADLIANSLGEAIKLALGATGLDLDRQNTEQDERSATTAA